MLCIVVRIPILLVETKTEQEGRGKYVLLVDRRRKIAEASEARGTTTQPHGKMNVRGSMLKDDTRNFVWLKTCYSSRGRAMRILFRLSRDTRSVTVSYRMMYYLMMHFKQTSILCTGHKFVDSRFLNRKFHFSQVTSTHVSTVDYRFIGSVYWEIWTNFTLFSILHYVARMVWTK